MFYLPIYQFINYLVYLITDLIVKASPVKHSVCVLPPQLETVLLPSGLSYGLAILQQSCCPKSASSPMPPVPGGPS